MNQLQVIDGEKQPYIIQVAADTVSKHLALSIAAEVRKALNNDAHPNVSLHAIGPSAVSNALKGIIIANTHLATMGVMLAGLPSFKDQDMPAEQGQEGTVQRTIVRIKILCCHFGG